MPSPEPDKTNIVLTGFMGTGKTTAGRLVAEKLGLDFVDTDAIIESRHGPIPEIFRAQGEAGFRAIERALARELADRHGLVISTGGRMMLDAENVASLGHRGHIICLVATPEEILRRVSADGPLADRPMLSGSDPRQRIVELLTERGPGYGHFPQLVTSGLSPEAVARELIDLVSSDPFVD